MICPVLEVAIQAAWERSIPACYRARPNKPFRPSCDRAAIVLAPPPKEVAERFLASLAPHVRHRDPLGPARAKAPQGPGKAQCSAQAKASNAAALRLPCASLRRLFNSGACRASPRCPDNRACRPS